MTGRLNFDRFFSLQDVNAYPGSNYLDRVIQLFNDGPTQHRVWLIAPEGEPTLWFDQLKLTPKTITEKPVRWIDYGIAQLPKMDTKQPTWEGFLRVRIQGLTTAVCAQSHLLITIQTELNLAGLELGEAQRRLWGMAQHELGITTIRPSRVPVGQPATFTTTFRAGPKGLPAGAYIRFAMPKALSQPQIEDVNEPGFTELLNGDGRVRIAEIRNMHETHEKASIVCQVERPLAPNESFSISYSTARMFIYPHFKRETEIRTWFSMVPPLSAGVAVSAQSPFISMRPQDGHMVEFMAGPSERLHLFLPGRRYQSERLTVRGLFTDRYRNVPPTDTIDADIELFILNGTGRQSLGTLSGCFEERYRFVMPLPVLEPGIYRVEAIHRQTGQSIAISNPLEIVPDGAGDRLYWGEIHCHTEMSDGAGDFSGVYRHAREEGALDFAAVTDHAENLSDNQWAWMKDVTNRWHESGRFVTLVGYEWIGKQADRILYTARPDLPLLRGDYQGSENLADLWGQFHNDPQVVGGPHATLVHQTKWEQHDATVERYAEIYSMWGSCDFRDSPLVTPWIGPDRGVTVNDLLMQGAKLGFTAGGDCHDGRVGFTSEDPDGQGVTPHTFAALVLFRCGMTAANMPALTRDDLVTALRERLTYATTGARMLLSFEVSGIGMGKEGTAEQVICTATIHAVSLLERVEIVKDGAIVWQQPLNGLDQTVEWTDPERPTDEHYYYLHVIQADGQRAWSSPVWVKGG